MAGTAVSGSARTGVAESSIAPTARTSRVLTRPFEKPARVSVRASGPATSCACARSRGAAARITAPVPAAALPAARVSSATASHSWWRSGLPVSSPARVPEASSHWSPWASIRRAIHSGRARPTTTPTRTSAGTTGSGPRGGSSVSSPGPSAEPPAAGCAAIRSSGCTSRRHRADPPPREERSPRTKAGMSAAGTRTPSETAAMTSAAVLVPTRSAPSSRARPQRGSTGRETNRRPRSVARPSSATAPRRVSSASASARARDGSGSGRAMPSPPGEPHTASARHAAVRSAVRTSGTVWAGMAPQAAPS